MKNTASPEPVQAWEETVTIPTYGEMQPDRNPIFLEKRVYQGSTGKVYPNPFTDRVSDRKINKEYQAVFLENEYLKLMILPAIGGRIHVGLDKTNNYDFIYRQTVIKPALVGLLGPWISGGIEFNWPQHHRPSTFMPVDYAVEKHADGSQTVWLSEHEPMNRMKGMVGICLYPGKALVEAKVQLYNRTPFVQTFLWWANVGIRVHEHYQAFFPPDVTYVADHAKRAVSEFPIARGTYYGVDYSQGVDITWYKNIPVPTSYMVTESRYDFFGGYDHNRQAGIVHVANHYISPGKKLWTWGNAEFGYAWDRNLTDSDGPYIELMAGVYTDNQPDFSWLQPYETRTFSQFWYPIQEIGPVKNANRLLAVNLETRRSTAKLGVCATESLSSMVIRLSTGDRWSFERHADLVPGKPFVEETSLPAGMNDSELLLTVCSADGQELIRYQPETVSDKPLPSPATEPPEPELISTGEELFLTGLHLEQYRHATRSPTVYWHEAIRRDPNDVRSNNALGLQCFHRGLFSEAERYFRSAISTLTRRNPNPYDGEPYYNLDLAVKSQERWEEAYAAFYKAAWNYAWQSASYYSLAEIDCRRHNWIAALEHLDRSLLTNAMNLKARNLKAVVLRRHKQRDLANLLLLESMRLDQLDFWSRTEFWLLEQASSDTAESIEHFKALLQLLHEEPQTLLDVALDYAGAGLWEEARQLLQEAVTLSRRVSCHPMIHYMLGYLSLQIKRTDEALGFFQEAS